MPSKQDICVVQEPMSNQTDFLPSEVEDLVAAIKHNLQLKSKPPRPLSLTARDRRMSPYSAPVRTVCKYAGDKENIRHSSQNCKYCILRSKSPHTTEPDDPYEMLQELLREGSLIKEAVKRLQLNSNNKKSKKTDFYEFDDLAIDIKTDDI